MKYAKRNINNEDERIYAAEYLYTLVPFFFKFKRPLINLIANKLRSLEFSKNDLICRLNSQNSVSWERVYIIYKGEVVQGTSSGSI